MLSRPGARSPAEAVRTFLAPLQRALSCVTDAVLLGGGHRPAPEPHAAALQGGLPVSLAGGERLSLRVLLGYRVVVADDAWWAVEVSSYVMGLDRVGAGELVVYHWHPEGQSPVRWPHLHVGAGAGARPPVLRAHLPTGSPVALPALLRLAITELGVEPRREDWEAVLAASEGSSRW